MKKLTTILFMLLFLGLIGGTTFAQDSVAEEPATEVRKEDSAEKSEKRDMTMPNLNGNWIVIEAEGVNVRDGQITLLFMDGNILGQGPCKRFKTHVEIEGGTFQFGPLKLRGSVCAKDIMADENTYLRILARLSHFEIEADGTLVLSSFGAAKIRAVREK